MTGNPTDTTTITVRLTPEEVSRVDEMRGDGVSRSAFVRELLRRSGPATEQPSYPEALTLLARSARAGKVQAQVAWSGLSAVRRPRTTATGWRGCSMAPTTELRRFRRFAEGVGLHLEDFQLDVMDAVLSNRREVVISQPRGAGKTTLLGLYALWELIRHPDATIIVAASARDQAQHLYRAAMRFAKQVPELRNRLTFTLREVRTPQDGRLIVVNADSEKQMGHDPYLVIVDELGSHVRDDLYVSLRSALIKNPEARMRIISTMGGHEEAPMPSMRRRVLEEGNVMREGPVLRAETTDSLWLEWSVPEGADVDDMEVVKAVNPREAITVEMLAEHRRVLHESAFRRLHCNQNLPTDDAFITADAWDRCGGPIDIPPGSSVIAAVDAGIRRDSTAVVTVRKDDAGARCAPGPR